MTKQTLFFIAEHWRYDDSWTGGRGSDMGRKICVYAPKTNIQYSSGNPCSGFFKTRDYMKGKDSDGLHTSEIFQATRRTLEAKSSITEQLSYLKTLPPDSCWQETKPEQHLFTAPIHVEFPLELEHLAALLDPRTTPSAALAVLDLYVSRNNGSLLPVTFKQFAIPTTTP